MRSSTSRCPKLVDHSVIWQFENRYCAPFPMPTNRDSSVEKGRSPKDPPSRQTSSMILALTVHLAIHHLVTPSGRRYFRTRAVSDRKVVLWLLIHKNLYRHLESNFCCTVFPPNARLSLYWNLPDRKQDAIHS